MVVDAQDEHDNRLRKYLKCALFGDADCVVGLEQ
jgi:hypothetical protein